jgi:hypothetical protein
MVPQAGSERQSEEETSWLMVTPGLPVIGVDGAPIGRVTHVLGDTQGGIFHGVAFRQQLWTAPRIVQAAQIARITTRGIYLALRQDQVQALPVYQEEPVYQLGRTGLLGRSEGWRKDDQ